MAITPSDFLQEIVNEQLKASEKHFKINYNLKKCIEYSYVHNCLLKSLRTNKRVVLADDFNVCCGTNEPATIRHRKTRVGFGMRQII